MDRPQERNLIDQLPGRKLRGTPRSLLRPVRLEMVEIPGGSWLTCHTETSANPAGAVPLLPEQSSQTLPRTPGAATSPTAAEPERLRANVNRGAHE